jgi:hypothetical protein
MSAVSDEIALRIKAEMARRAVYETAAYYLAVRAMLIASLHAQQQAVVSDIASGVRYISLCCSRRAGKTHLVATLIVILLLEARFGEDIVFVAPTKQRGKELIWDEVERIIDAYALPWVKSESQGKVKTSVGGRFRIVGLDKKKEVGKVARGGNTKAFFADESQEYAHLLQAFLVAASPALAQSRGIFVASGTPGIAESGYWHAICHGKDGFKSLNWTLLDNPHLGRPAEDILREERELKGWSETHPDYVREWLGKWTRDVNRLVFEYDAKKNWLDAPPGYDVKTWRHIIGMDYGFNDPCAWVVLAAEPNSTEAYVVHVEKESELDSDGIAATTKRLKDAYHPVAIVGDSASGGLTFMADFNRRYGLKAGAGIRPARKHDLPGSIKNMNTELRRARLVLCTGAEPLAEELVVIQYDDEDRKKILTGPAFPDHATDACRYAVNEFTNFAHKPKKREKTPADLELELREQMNQAGRDERAA